MKDRLEALFLEYQQNGSYDTIEKTCRALFKGAVVYLPLRHEAWNRGQVYTWDPIRSLDFLESFLVIRGEFGSIEEHHSFLLLSSQNFARAPILRNCAFLEGPFPSVAGSLALFGKSRALTLNLNGKMDIHFGTINEFMGEYNRMLPLLDAEMRGPSFDNFLYGEGTGVVSEESLKNIPKETLQMLRFWVNGCPEIEEALLFCGTHDRSEPDKILLATAVRKAEQTEYLRERFASDMAHLRRKNPELLILALVGTINLEKFIPRDTKELSKCYQRIK
jgi:hypothetical protein